MNNEKGFTLLEVLAAMAILSIVLMSFMAVFANTDRLAIRNSEKLIIINLADAYLERIKINPSEFIGTLPPTLTSCPSPDTSKKCKTVTVTPDPINEKTYAVTIIMKQDSTEQGLKLLDTTVQVSSADSKIKSSVEGYVSYEE
ncbi:MAG: type II secretion system GspH family protein [Planococcus sp. (in: firmicutes)]|uniref:type IV pilus modification PilV family protein n=1 Tax=Planococcus halocryophilus TaxID=1215089 RepID=UPI001F111C47|nr:type II secretion system protein [Planococcus halocryophilus]MCH4825619.1 type II secretion system GspH family protein [Planococcus halocryophilus]